MKVKFLDLTVSPSEREILRKILDDILARGQIVGGTEVAAFENLMRKEARHPHALAVSSGTAAVWLALRLLGVGRGDEVITSALGWLGTVNPICVCGAIPRFVDINPDLNISPAAIRKTVSPKTKAILAVHYTGYPCDMDAILKIAEEFGLSVIEDCAQSCGAHWHDRPVGSMGDVGAFSMNPMKLFSAFGECGAVVFNNSDWLEKAYALRHNGLYNGEYCFAPSLNLKPDTLQCGFLLAKYQCLESVIKRREENAMLYDKRLKGIVSLPATSVNVKRVYYTYTIRCTQRDRLQQFLMTKGIETKVRHPILLSEQNAYAMNQISRVPEANRARKEILCLPIHENLTNEDVNYVADCIGEFYKVSH